jgi:hypothetical protein
MKAINTRINYLMTFYADYTKAVEDRMKFEYGTPEYEEAGHRRDMYGAWLREELDALNAAGIDMSRFDYIK